MSNKCNALIVGMSKGGKTTSLHGIKNQEKAMYLNCEAGKEVPFPKCKFKQFTITDPYEVHEAFKHVEKNPDKIDTIIIDTATMLMEMFYSNYVHSAAEKVKFKAWANYAEFFKTLVQKYVATTTASVIVLAHSERISNQDTMVVETKVPVQGQLAKKGIEAYFTTILAAKRVSVASLSAYENKLLHVTPEEELKGVKHVYQTQITKETVDEKLSSSIGMWTQQETFIDNNAQYVLDRLHSYYK